MARGPLAGVLGSSRTSLHVYVLGPGVGECQVVLFPDGRVLVVDACEKGGRNFGIELLRALGVTRVDLFVVTHPDKDHVRGAGAFLRAFSPDRVWVYPVYGSLRDVLVKARRLARDRGLTTSAALHDLGDFSEALDDQPEGRVEEVGSQPAPWSFVSCGYSVTPIAPTSADRRHAARLLRTQADLPESPTGRARAFVGWVDDFLIGGRRPDDHPNALSVALAIEFGERRLILGGDVEHHATNGYRGWEGVRKKLAEASTNKSHLLRGLAAIKVPHHGSEGAFCDAVWAEHLHGGTDPVGIIAPYSPSGLPDDKGLAKLRGRCARLAITTTLASTRGHASASGWREATPTAQAEDFPMVAIEVPPSGPIDVSVWGEASVWT